MFPLHLYILLLALFAFLAPTAARVCFGCPSAATIFLHQSNSDSEVQLPLIVEDRGIPGVDEELYCEYKSTPRGQGPTFCTYWAFGDLKEAGKGTGCPGEAVVVRC